MTSISVAFCLWVTTVILVSALKDVKDEAETMAEISGGTTSIGLEKPVIPQDGEGPIRLIELPTFYLDKTEVTNEQFQKFVSATGYVTEVCSKEFRPVLEKESQVVCKLESS